MPATRSFGSTLGVCLVAALLSACGEGADAGDPAAEDPASPSASTADASPTANEAFEPVDFGSEPALDSPFKRAALEAVDDDLPAMIPTLLPDGWATVGGGYQPDPQWWRLELTAPTGAVVLDQLPGSSKARLGDQDDLTPSEDVDLSAFGTGAWSAWDHAGAAVLAYDLKDSTVIVQAADVDTARSLAESLLPAEDSGEQQD